MTDTRPIGLIPPHPNRHPHPANGMTAEVHVGDGAFCRIIDPTADAGLEWVLRYGEPASVRMAAASIISTYDYLLSGGLSMAEATRRLRILRQARKALQEKARKEVAA